MADAKFYSNLFAHPTYPTQPFLVDFNIASRRLRHARWDYKDLARLREASPCVLAFISAADPEVITIAHTQDCTMAPSLVQRRRRQGGGRYRR
jgi:hypothetical protein